MSVLHKADQIKLFALGKFCHHFVWKGYNIHSWRSAVVLFCHSNCHPIDSLSFFLNCMSSAPDINRRTPEPEWICITANSQWNLYSRNPLIASWKNVCTILSNSILPVNGKAGRDHVLHKTFKASASQRGPSLSVWSRWHLHIRGNPQSILWPGLKIPLPGKVGHVTI